MRNNKELMHVILENIGYASDIMLYSGDGGQGQVYKQRQLKDQRNEMLHKVYYGFDSGDTDTILAIVWCKNTHLFLPKHTCPLVLCRKHVASREEVDESRFDYSIWSSAEVV